MVYMIPRDHQRIVQHIQDHCEFEPKLYRQLQARKRFSMCSTMIWYRESCDMWQPTAVVFTDTPPNCNLEQRHARMSDDFDENTHS